MPKWILTALALAVALLPPPGSHAADPSPPVELTVYAAASLTDVLGQVAPVCEREIGARLVFNFGASNDLARQITAANKADVFLSADEGWMDHVEKAGLLDTASRRDLLSNRLVVIVPIGSSLVVRSAADLASPPIRRLSLADPGAVPAGKYAKAWLEKKGVWEKVRERALPAPDVRAALAAVEAGAAEAGIVYRTDAATARRSKVAFDVPEEEGPKITYPVAALKDRPDVEAARRLVTCFSGRAASGLFTRAGFTVLASD